MPLPPRLGGRRHGGLGLGHQFNRLVDCGDCAQAGGRGGSTRIIIVIGTGWVAAAGGREQDEGVGGVFLPERVGLGGRLEEGCCWRGVEG